MGQALLTPYVLGGKLILQEKWIGDVCVGWGGGEQGEVGRGVGGRIVVGM